MGIDSFLAGLEEGPRALLIVGEAGIGKTSLLRATLARAEQRSIRVLIAQPARAEAELTFAGLGDLLRELAPEALAELPSPQRRALEVALLIREPEARPPDPLALGSALLGLLRNVAAPQPLLVAVDDVQWLDGPSAAALEFAARRLRDEQIRIVAAHRIGGGKIPFDLERALPVERLEVGPLSMGALHRLLRERLGATFSRPILRRLHATSGGNPFFALELARALERRGGKLAAGEELPVPESLDELVRERLDALPDATRVLLARAAALAEPALELVGAEEDLEAALDAGIVDLDGRFVRFTHPLLASGAYARLTPTRRRELHRELAGLVHEPEERARHLALSATRPDPAVALALDEAAQRSRMRGAPGVAAELTESALRMTDPHDDEAVGERRAAAADDHLITGNLTRSRELLELALADCPAGPRRGRLLLQLGYVTEGANNAEAESLYAEALTEARGDDALEAEVHHRVALLLPTLNRFRDAEAPARAALELAKRSSDPVRVVQALVPATMIAFTRGRGVSTEMMERALALEPLCPLLLGESRPGLQYGWMLQWAGDIDGSRALLERAQQAAREQDDAYALGTSLFFSAFLELLAEDWHRGLAYAAEMREIGEQTGADVYVQTGFVAEAVLQAHLGDESRTRQAIVAATQSAHAVAAAGWALGLLELSLDRPQEALAHLRRATELYRSSGIEEPAFFYWFPLQAEAAIAVSEVGEATALLAWLEERAVRLDREWALACIARCRGLVAATRGDEAGARAAFGRALAEHERVAYRTFDLARTLLAFGTTLRRFKRKREAREALERALGIFVTLGARLWTAKTRSELARISGRAPGGGELTETERRVARLVAEGRSNKEVAAALFVTVRTVEWNLTKIYGKTGVRSRTELAGRLVGGALH